MGRGREDGANSGNRGKKVRGGRQGWREWVTGAGQADRQTWGAATPISQADTSMPRRSGDAPKTAQLQTGEAHLPTHTLPTGKLSSSHCHPRPWQLKTDTNRGKSPKEKVK